MGGESKQVKVDNWGIFFLQRLQTFFNKTYFCDLTLQFDDNVQLKVHRLVMNACTEYFQVLEQTCEVINDCLIMPPDLQADVVVPIVNFMYTGILEFQTSIFDRLYSTARLMNMTVLTKLLDAQKIPISPITKPISKRSPISPITWNLQGKRIAPKTMDPDLPETLPGRKLPIWKRKSVPTSTIAYRNDMICSLPDPLSNRYFRTNNVDDAPKPTRFEWPEDDDTNFDTNSFDEISYTSKPIIIPQREKSPKPSTSSNNFEELKRSSISVKRPGSPIYNDSKKVNIQDVKEYMKEQKIRSDYIEYDDAEAADNDLQSYENHDSDDDRNKDEVFDQNNEDSPNKSILKHDAATPHNKRVRFSLEGKENAAKSSSTAATIKTNTSTVDMSNHTKIITEVLKKYPHLVKKNKNIRLKILAKGANTGSPGAKTAGNPVKVAKPAVKVNYMVMKPGENNKTASPDSKKDGHWSCHKCSNPNPLHFETYYLYRKHLTEVHNEKTDSQMCNICGHISRKQNMLVYHKFIKHNVTPPPSYHFPKCKDCSYVALSPALLTKHQVIHTQQTVVCSECNTTFQTKSALISHIHLTGHNDKNNCPTHDCTYCSKKFISDETLFQHIKNNHKIEAKSDNILNQEEEETPEVRKENIITAEEIDAMEETSSQQQIEKTVPEKPKEKIKILSNVKVTTPIKRKLEPVKMIPTEPQPEPTQVVDSQPLEPSSEAESLSNVASGIAASLGLVNTIVVLDENQFILQSQDGIQENIITTNPQNIILPNVSNINNIQNLVSQHQVITTDTQIELNKNNITSTDELVMVLTDHDYSDASNNAVITSEKSNIVFLYSHPVQSHQDGQFITQPGNVMMNSDMGLVEVSNNFVANAVPIEQKPCEESIELIQQEIDNHLENETQDIQQQDKIVEEQIAAFDEKTDDVPAEEQENNEISTENSELERMEVDEPETEEHQQRTTDEQHMSEEHQHLTTEQQHITEEHQQHITDEHQQHIAEEHQNMTYEHQHRTDEHQQHITGEHQQHITGEHQQHITDEHQQNITDEHQNMAYEHQHTTDEHQQHITNEHQNMTYEHQHTTDEHQQHITDEQQQHITDEHQNMTYEHQHTTDEHQQHITDEHQQHKIGEDQHIMDEHQQNVIEEHQQTIVFDKENETQVPSQETNEIHQDSEEIRSLPEEMQIVAENMQPISEEMQPDSENLQQVSDEMHQVSLQPSEEMQPNSEDMSHSGEIQPISEDMHSVSEEIQLISEKIKAVSDELQQHSESMQQISEEMPQVSDEAQNDSLPEHEGDNHFEEPMEIEESIEMIQQEIHRSSTEQQEFISENSESVDIPPCRLPTNIQTELNDEKEFSEIQGTTEPVQDIQKTIEQEETLINKVQENELTNEHQEMSNENEEIEHMEVDSAKLISNTVVQSEIIEPTIEQKESKIENTEHSPLISDENIPDSEEEKPLTEINLSEITEPENILSPEKEQIPENSGNETEEETIENIEKEIKNIPAQNSDSPTNIETNINPETQETVEPIIETNENQQIEENIETTENTEISSEIENQNETDKTNDESMFSSEDLNQETEEVKIAVQSNSTVNNDSLVTNSKISNLLDDWDDGDTDSQTSDTPKQMPVSDNTSSINTLINDWEDEEET